MSTEIPSAPEPAIACPQCGAALPENAPHGLCPSCLMGIASIPTDADADTLPLNPRTDLPSLGEVAAAFPDLEVLDVIGHGGMSVVYRARQPRLDRLVALKILPKTLAATPGFPERFTREGRVLARLKHPNIVTVHDFGESGGFFYLLMEHVDGVNLRQAMRAGRFTPEQALDVVPVMCEALQYAHSEGVLHRDIKPENILLDSKGRVKIADFGIAKIIGDSADAVMLTQSGAKLGTAPYMAPEQIEQPATVDHRADIYSLGVVFYEMLTGELPLGRFAAPSERAAVGGNVDAVVFRALEKERSRRQQSAGEMKTQIDGLSRDWSAAPPRPYWPGQSFEYKSKRTLFGLPLLHVTSGIDPATGRRRVARGFFAFGDSAVGVIAFGGFARGIVAVGGFSFGIIAVGGLGLGLVSWCGLALALVLAVGGLAIAPLATGGAAIGLHALGGVAIGWHAIGGMVFAHQGMGSTVHATIAASHLSEMSAPVQWLRWLSPWTSLGSFLWLPLMLPTLIVPQWARRQLEMPAGSPRDSADPPGRSSTHIFWLIPASFVVGLVGWLLIYLWATRAGPEIGYFIAPGLIAFIGLVMMSLCLPLALRLVPMNSLYGIRLPASYASERRWYDINAYGGTIMAGWSVVIIGVGLVGCFVLPRYRDPYVSAGVGMAILAVVFPVAQILWWVRRLPAEGPVPRRRQLDFLWGKFIIALPLAFFIKTFVSQSFTVLGASVAPEVPPHSHLLVWKLNIHFSPGDLVTYDHAGMPYLGRVARVEKDRLWITRNNLPEQPIDVQNITGRLVFQTRP